MRCRFGRVEPVPRNEPVQHVSWEEADAYARGGETATDGSRVGAGREAGRAPRRGLGLGVDVVGLHRLSGLPGVPVHAEYSEAFFGPEYKVLRGASWATSPTVARVTFRNWDFPIRRQIFAGFRCASDV